MDPHKCTKSEDIKQIEKVLYGNGKKGLVASTLELFDKLDSFQNTVSKSIEAIQADVKVLLQFQNQVEVKEQQNEKYEIKLEKMKKDEIKTKRWRLVFASTTILSILGLIITLLSVIYNPPKINNEIQGVTEAEWKKLWEDFKKENNVRSIVLYQDSIN